MNYEIKKFESDLINIINASLLPIELKRLVLSEILTKVSAVSNAEIEKEMRESEVEKDEQKLCED